MTGGSFWQRLFGSGSEGELPERAPEAPVASFDFDHARIARVARDKVATIRGLIPEREARAALQASVEALAELRQIDERYLPQLLQSYIDIPADYRAEIYRQTGHSASYALGDRLDLIIGRLHEISALLAQNKLDSIRQAIDFIDLRFGKSPLDL